MDCTSCSGGTRATLLVWCHRVAAATIGRIHCIHAPFCRGVLFLPPIMAPLGGHLMVRRVQSWRISNYSPNLVEVEFSEVCIALVQHPCRLGRLNVNKRSNKTRLTTSYPLMRCAVAGCATGSTR